MNQDGLTLLRELYLVQGTSYTIYLAFRDDGATATTPTFANFSFAVTSSAGSVTLFSSAVLSASGNAAYPVCFTAIAQSNALTTALGSQAALTGSGVLSWASGASTTVLSPFNVQITATGAAGQNQGNTSLGGNGTTYATYATAASPVTVALTSASENYWYVDSTLSPATFNLPDATTVAGITYTFQKTAGSLNNALTVHCASGQQIKSFSRLTARDSGRTVAISQGVFYDASLFVKALGDSITLIAVAGGWITDDFTGDVV